MQHISNKYGQLTANNFSVIFCHYIYTRILKYDSIPLKGILLLYCYVSGQNFIKHAISGNFPFNGNYHGKLLLVASSVQKGPDVKG